MNQAEKSSAERRPAAPLIKVRSGSVTVVAAALIAVLATVTALVLGFSNSVVRAARFQNATDLAALSAAQAVQQGAAMPNVCELVQEHLHDTLTSYGLNRCVVEGEIVELRIASHWALDAFLGFDSVRARAGPQ